LDSSYTNTAGAHVTAVNVPPPLTIATLSPLPDGRVSGRSVRLAIRREWRRRGLYLVSSLKGPAPPGLSISANGFISGTPTTPFQSTFSVRVTDSNGQTAAKDFRLTVPPQPLVITTTGRYSREGTEMKAIRNPGFFGWI